MVVKGVIETDLVLKTRFFSENIFCLPARIQTFLTWEKILISQEQELRLAAKKGPVERTHELED